jgi:predicted O-methyltransferase YrrM
MNRNEIIAKALSIDGWFDENHTNVLFDLADKYIKTGGNVLEVGSWKGRSSYILASICKERGAHLICMDSFSGLVVPDYSKPQEGHIKWNLYMEGRGYYTEAAHNKKFIKNIKENLKEFDVEYLKGDSKKLHKKILNESLDLCFIDGDHDSPGVNLDMKNFWPKVKRGGIFCGHDFEEGNDVAKAIHEKFGPNINSVNTVWSIEK